MCFELSTYIDLFESLSVIVDQLLMARSLLDAECGQSNPLVQLSSRIVSNDSAFNNAFRLPSNVGDSVCFDVYLIKVVSIYF
jgi:hypothetical protein